MARNFKKHYFDHGKASFKYLVTMDESWVLYSTSENKESSKQGSHTINSEYYVGVLQAFLKHFGRKDKRRLSRDFCINSGSHVSQYTMDFMIQKNMKIMLLILQIWQHVTFICFSN
ncbi:unnamed protein product [Lepeophtheirus salmonis]|uniref:(salmon louse) hypothetical protein n=1 Tax=Lepeophtheirus salmonis TaxID=72036 RepID=A0A7R8CY22_LEPSM|nr:unnamed protein product [Lepeophtheirus salmonis]CAF2966451.1 unnamed protein product [Lepeophtheirus salmonis]